jgi:hypothetical protein
VDSGSSFHMTNSAEKNVFGAIRQEYDLKDPILLSCVGSHQTARSGQISLDSTLGEIRSIHVPNSDPILSMGELVKSGYDFTWKSRDFSTPTLTRKDGTLLKLRVDQNCPMYSFGKATGASRMDITTLPEQHDILHFPSRVGCIICEGAKMKISPARSVNPEEVRRARKPLERVSMDILESTTVGFREEIYLLTMMDDFSRHIAVYPQKFKAASSNLESLKTFIQKFGKPKLIRTDVGSEFLSCFESFVKENRIDRELSVQYRSTTNSRHERMHSEINRGIRTVLLQAGLSDDFWADAAKYVAFCINHLNIGGGRSRCSVFRNKRDEIIAEKGHATRGDNYGEQEPSGPLCPCVKRIMKKFTSFPTFGCLAIYYDDDSPKLMSKGKIGLLIGIPDQESFLILDGAKYLKESVYRVTRTRDVRLHTDIFPATKYNLRTASDEILRELPGTETLGNLVFCDKCRRPKLLDEIHCVKCRNPKAKTRHDNTIWCGHYKCKCEEDVETDDAREEVDVDHSSANMGNRQFIHLDSSPAQGEKHQDEELDSSDSVIPISKSITETPDPSNDESDLPYPSNREMINWARKEMRPSSPRSEGTLRDEDLNTPSGSCDTASIPLIETSEQIAHMSIDAIQEDEPAVESSSPSASEKEDTSSSEEEETEALRKSSRQRKPPHRYGYSAIHASQHQQRKSNARCFITKVIPYHDIKETNEGRSAIQHELDKMIAMEVFRWDEALPYHEARKRADSLFVGSRFVTGIKNFELDPSQHKIKARLVATGCYLKDNSGKKTEADDFPFDSPVGIQAIRLVVANALAVGHDAFFADIESAYLHSPLRGKETFVSLPKEVLPSELQTMENPVLPLRKALYGLPRSGSDFARYLREIVEKLGWKQSSMDLNLYIKGKMMLAIYVDDVAISGPTKMLEAEMRKLMGKVTIRDYEKLSASSEFAPIRYIGMELYLDDDMLVWDGRHYAQYIVEFTKKIMASCGMIPSKKKAQLPFSSNPDTDKLTSTEKLVEHAAEIVGMLLWHNRTARPDISYPVSVLSKNVHPKYWTNWMDEVLSKTVRYLEQNPMQLQWAKHGKAEHEIQKVLGYSDSDFGGCESTKRSTTGWVAFVAYGEASDHQILIDWGSKRQSVIAPSTAAAELNALCVSHDRSFGPIQNILVELLGWTDIQVFCDNTAAIQIIRNGFSPALRVASKSMKINVGRLHEILTPDEHEGFLSYVSSNENPADLFTKHLGLELFSKHRKRIGLVPTL